MTRDLALSRGSIKPLRHYCFIHDQGYAFVDDFFCVQNVVMIAALNTTKKDQLIWYPEGIARGVLTYKTRLVDIPPVMCFMPVCFDRID